MRSQVLYRAAQSDCHICDADFIAVGRQPADADVSAHQHNDADITHQTTSLEYSIMEAHAERCIVQL